jgi:hypothetical protein
MTKAHNGYRPPALPTAAEYIHEDAQPRVYHAPSKRFGYASARRLHLWYVTFDDGDALWVNREAVMVVTAKQEMRHKKIARDAQRKRRRQMLAEGYPTAAKRRALRDVVS